MKEQEKSSEKYFFAINEERVAFATYEEARAAREAFLAEAGFFDSATSIKTRDASGKTVEVEMQSAPIRPFINVDEDEE